MCALQDLAIALLTCSYVWKVLLCVCGEHAEALNQWCVQCSVLLATCTRCLCMYVVQCGSLLSLEVEALHDKVCGVFGSRKSVCADQTCSKQFFYSLSQILMACACEIQ